MATPAHPLLDLLRALRAGSTVAIGLLAIGTMQPAYAAPCGPGAHWIDACAGGTDTLPTSIVAFGVDLDFDGSPEFDAVFVGGPAVIDRSGPLDDSLNFPGLRPLDGHPDVIDTEILSMTLTGQGDAAGWTLRVGKDAGVSSAPAHPGPRSSRGAIGESPINPWVADSFFDIFVEIDIPGGTLHNDDPLRISTIIDRVPPDPGTDYAINGVPGFETSVFPLPLLDDNETVVAQLTDLTTGGSGHHLITPEPTSMVLLGTAVIGLLSLRRRGIDTHSYNDSATDSPKKPWPTREGDHRSTQMYQRKI